MISFSWTPFTVTKFTESSKQTIKLELKRKKVLISLFVSTERPGRLQLHHFCMHLSCHTYIHLGDHPRDQKQDLSGDQPAFCSEKQGGHCGGGWGL